MEEQAIPKIQENYFSLIQKVGSNGYYQWLIFLIVVISSTLTTFSLNNIAYLFKNPSFDCSHIQGKEYLSSDQCSLYVCDNFSDADRSGFLVPLNGESASTQFGPYLCQDSYLIGSIRGLNYLGNFFGIFLIIYISDNFSRRKAYLLCIAFHLTGNIIAALSQDIYMLAFGLFITGLGLLGVVKISTVILSEVTEKKLRQKFLTSCMMSFGIGVMIIGYSFQAIGNWRKTLLFVAIIPSFFCFVLIFFFMKDTPKYILRNFSAEQAADQFNWIAKINNEQYRYAPEQLQPKIQQQEHIRSLKKTVSPIDLCTYRSLRIPTLLFSLSAATANITYFSHNFIADSVGISASFNMMVFGFGDIMGSIISLIFVDKVERVKTGFIAMMSASLIKLIAFLIQVPNDCDYCSAGLAQIILLGIERGIHQFWWGIFANHLVQFYPVSIKSIGVSSTTASSGLFLFFGELILTSLHEKGISIKFYMVIVGVICSLLFSMTPQTKDQKDKDQINQLSQILEKQRQQEKEKNI